MSRLFSTDWNWEDLAPIAHYDVQELAKLCGISTRQLQRFFRRHFHCTPQHWLNERRLLAARNLLRTGDSVKKVALDLGYKQASHFCRQFKSRNKMTPSQFALSQNENVKCRSGITDVAAR
jgi:AraC-like DNA-binding protein